MLNQMRAWHRCNDHIERLARRECVSPVVQNRCAFRRHVVHDKTKTARSLPRQSLAPFVDNALRCSRAHWQRNVVALQPALTKVKLTPPQLQHWPATLARLTLVHAAAQVPPLLVPSSFKPQVGSMATLPEPRLL